MRIISGTHKRRAIRPPKNLAVRPTTDMAKESLFNVLSNAMDFEAVSALDLFSGTGSIAFELISRGCLKVTAVDQNKASTDWIKKAAIDFNMENLLVKTADSFTFISRSAQHFDFIFADPPYDLEGLDSLNHLIFKHQLLRPNGWLVIEHPQHIDFSGQDYFIDHRHYGKVNFSLFHFQAPE